LSEVFGKVNGNIFLGEILARFVNVKILEYIPASCTAAFVAGIIAFSIITYKRKTSETNAHELDTLDDNYEPPPERSLILGRLALNGAICGTPIFCYFYLNYFH